MGEAEKEVEVLEYVRVPFQKTFPTHTS